MKACPTCGQRYVGGEEFCPRDGATLAALDLPQDDLLIGTIIDGRYRVEKKIGEGGMGVVYLATHAVIGKKCAVKVLGGQHQGESEVAERFTQEARAAAAIGNEHIIDITDFGQLSDGSAYFVMEYLDGKALQAVVNESKRIELQRTLHVVAQCCDALHAAHSADIVHRDLKPDNIFLVHRQNDPDFVKVLDFGIAKVARQTGRLTRTGMIFGTPQYMSPEQAAGTSIDRRTDIYSLGIIMYEMLSGRVPFEADTFMGVLTKHLYEEPIPPRRMVPPVDIPQSVEAILLKAIEKKPDRRYQTMADFGADVKSVLAGKTPTIVYEQMRDTSLSTVPPPSPSEVVSGRKQKRASAMEGRRPGRSRWSLVAIVALVAVAAGLAGFLWLGGSNRSKAAGAQPPAPVVIPRPAPSAPVVPPPKAEPVVPKAAQPIPVEHITISSKPEGASLYKDGALVGRLPVEVARPATPEGETRYQIKLDGYKVEEVVITDHTPRQFEVAMSIEPEPPAEPPAPVEKRHESRAGKRNKAAAEAHAEPAKDEAPPSKRKKTSLGQGDLADPWAQ